MILLSEGDFPFPTGNPIWLNNDAAVDRPVPDVSAFSPLLCDLLLLLPKITTFGDVVAVTVEWPPRYKLLVYWLYCCDGYWL